MSRTDRDSSSGCGARIPASETRSPRCCARSSITPRRGPTAASGPGRTASGGTPGPAPGGEELLFASAGGRPAIGSLYTARVTRSDDGITLHGTPGYTGSQAGQAARQALRAAHALAQTRLETLPAERDAARRSALDEALAPLLELAAPLRTRAQRDALAAYVLRRLHEARDPRRPPGGRQ